MLSQDNVDIAVARAAVASMATVLNSSVDIEKIIKGEYITKTKQVNLSSIIRKIVGTFRAMLASKGIAVHTSQDPTLSSRPMSTSSG